jgi:predicted RNA binding protein YcfA (HicA-like mRNA interferase family)
MKVREILKILYKDGWMLKEIKGSHIQAYSSN